MDKIVVKKREYSVVKELSSDDKCKSSLVSYKNKEFLVREFKTYDDYFEALFRYKSLIKSGIYIPKIVRKDKSSFKLVSEHISSKNMAQVLSIEEIDDKYFEGLFLLYKFCRLGKIELNYLPENFVMKGNYLYYTSLDLFEQNANINLENYGLEFWFPSKKGIEHLEKLGYQIDKKRQISDAELKKKIVLMSIKYW